jgi:diaminopimelate epimerase
MKLKFYKYQGAGNDFLIADNRDGSVKLTTEQIAALCDRRYGVGADGLMLLDAPDNEFPEGVLYRSPEGFRMTYYNSDGSGGMMCGNGGRCIVAFAADMGINEFSFSAADGRHYSEILAEDGRTKTVRLQMQDVDSICRHEVLTGVYVPSSGYFLNTGTRHFVRIVEGLDNYDVVGEGRDIRLNAEELKPIGANVNFIQPSGDGLLYVRTYEKGVEDETFACGTGIVASCIAAYNAGIEPSLKLSDGRVRYDVMAKRDSLSVEFRPLDGIKGVAESVFLTGPATFVAEIMI